MIQISQINYFELTRLMNDLNSGKIRYEVFQAYDLNNNEKSNGFCIRFPDYEEETSQGLLIEWLTKSFSFVAKSVSLWSKIPTKDNDIKKPVQTEQKKLNFQKKTNLALKNEKELDFSKLQANNFKFAEKNEVKSRVSQIFNNCNSLEQYSSKFLHHDGNLNFKMISSLEKNQNIQRRHRLIMNNLE